MLKFPNTKRQPYIKAIPIHNTNWNSLLTDIFWESLLFICHTDVLPNATKVVGPTLLIFLVFCGFMLCYYVPKFTF